jgi:hypothetical protein
MWSAPVCDKFFINDSTPTSTFPAIDAIERANWMFLGYMVDDFVNVLAQYPKLGKMVRPGTSSKRPPRHQPNSATSFME